MEKSSVTFSLFLLLFWGSGEIKANKPNYSYQYKVDDGYGNYQEKGETRVLNNAQGYYTVLEPNGNLRIVEYIANENGFFPKISYRFAGEGGTAAVKQSGLSGGYGRAAGIQLNSADIGGTHSKYSYSTSDGGYSDYSAGLNHFQSNYGNQNGLQVSQVSKFEINPNPNHLVYQQQVPISSPVVTNSISGGYSYVKPKVIAITTPFPQYHTQTKVKVTGGYSSNNNFQEENFRPSYGPPRQEYGPPPPPPIVVTTSRPHHSGGGYVYNKPRIPFVEGPLVVESKPNREYLPPIVAVSPTPIPAISIFSTPHPVHFLPPALPTAVFVKTPQQVQVVSTAAPVIAHRPPDHRPLQNFVIGSRYESPISHHKRPEKLPVNSLGKVQNPLTFSYGYDTGSSKTYHSYSGSGW